MSQGPCGDLNITTKRKEQEERQTKNKHRKTIIDFKILKRRKKGRKKERGGRKTPQNCKSPTQRQRFMTKTKSVTEEKEKKERE